MKIILICTKSITFNTFLKSQADYFIKKGFNTIAVCSDIKKLNFKNDLRYQIDFPITVIETFNIFKYFKIFIQINALIKKNPKAIFYLHTPVASHLFRLFTYFSKIKIIYFVHGFRFISKKNFLKSFIFKIIEKILKIKDFKKSFIFKIIEKILSYKTDIFFTINNEDFDYVNNNLKKKIKML